MPDSLRKVLLGALIGALIVAFAWHLAGERAKRAPLAAGGTPSAAAAGAKSTTVAGTASNDGPVIPVVATPSRTEHLALEVEALGTARANESIDVTAKVSNLVTAIRFTEGQQVRKGDMLVELDGAQARADLAVADAALKESNSQLQRSRELYETKVLSDAADRTRSNRRLQRMTRASPQRVRASTTRSSARRSMAASACGAQASADSWRPAPSSRRSTTPAPSSSTSPCRSGSCRR